LHVIRKVNKGMFKQVRLLAGISIFWLGLSMLSDGMNTLILPLHVNRLAAANHQATVLGLLTFFGLLAAALIQPVAGAVSDKLYPFLGRNKFIGIGLILSVVSLFFFATLQSLMGVIASYLAVQVSSSIAQAGQQALIPDLVDEDRRGLAAGWKGFMDLAGAMIGFVLLGQLLGANRLSLAIGIVASTLVVLYILAVLLTPEDRSNRQTKYRTHAIPLREVFRLDMRRQGDFIRLILSRFLFLLGIYSTGRFLLLFIAERLGLSADQAAEQAGTLLAGLALITILASPIAGWLADRAGRVPLMIAGAFLSALSSLLLIKSGNTSQILLFGGLMSLGSAAFSAGSWALLADLVPKAGSARFFGLANLSVAGAAAAAGLFGPMIDWVEPLFPGYGFSALFVFASLAFLASLVPMMKNTEWKEEGETNGNKRKTHSTTHKPIGLPLSADPAPIEEDQSP
jgi:MFS family permease